MRSKVRAYSHQGHGQRADHQAGYISATSDSTTSLANGSRSIHVGHDEALPLDRPNAGYLIGKETAAWAPGSGRDA